MAKLEEILPELRKGRRVKGIIWVQSQATLLDDDWELEPLPPKTVTITREELVKTWDRILWDEPGFHHAGSDIRFEKFAQALGLGEP